MEVKTVGITSSSMFCTDNWEHMLNKLFGSFMEFKAVNLHYNINKSNKHTAYEPVDFLMFDGGADVHPFFYGMFMEPRTSTSFDRDVIEMFLFKHYYYTPTKYIGICRGHQFLNTMMHGILCQDLATANRPHSTFHKVSIIHKTKLYKYLGYEDSIIVNSHHHQGVIMHGETLISTMLSDDGTIEGTESIGDDKIRSVQSHPEFLSEIDKGYDRAIDVMKYLFRVR